MPVTPGSEWQFEVPTTGTKRLPPDPRYVDGLAHQGYSFEAAIADLVDNSIDAGAGKVVVSFLRDGDQLVSLLMIDNGSGMAEPALDIAMTVGGQQRYRAGALGKFGTGLKAASMSHAASLTVISRTKTSSAVGRRWLTEQAREGFRCDVVEQAYCQALIDRYDGVIDWHGTIVRWDHVHDFESNGTDQADRYLNRTIEKLETHLGLYLHRFLEDEGFDLDIVVQDVHTGEELDHRGVAPLNPVGYRIPGKAGYPRTLTAPVAGIGDLAMVAHIWPPKSPLVEFKGIGPMTERQGFYFYRNDRLIQAGGWNGYRVPETHLSLARVIVDLPADSGGVFKLTVKKDGLNTTPAFGRGVELATDAEGAAFAMYLKDAEGAYRDAARRSEYTRKEALPVGKGVPPLLKRTLREELPALEDEDPVSFRWDRLPSDRFFELDREARVIVLNKEYRQAFNGDKRAGSNDAPVVKALLFLMTNEIFQKKAVRAVHTDNIDLWNAVLVSAVRCETER